MGFSVALLAFDKDRVQAVFDHYTLRQGQPVTEIDAGRDLKEPLKSMMADLGGIYSPALGYDENAQKAIFYVNLKQLELSQSVDAQSISRVAPLWMLEVYEGSSAAMLSQHIDGQEIWRLTGIYGESVTKTGDCPFDLDVLNADNAARAMRLRDLNGDDYQAQENYVPEQVFAGLTGGVTYAGEIVETMREVHGNLPVTDSRKS